jgi:hypothetical protein
MGRPLNDHFQVPLPGRFDHATIACCHSGTSGSKNGAKREGGDGIAYVRRSYAAPIKPGIFVLTDRVSLIIGPLFLEREL